MADVAVVEAHDVKAARREIAAEIVLPGDHLRAEAHDQQRRLISRIAERLVTERDVVADVAEALIHDPRMLAADAR